VTADVQFESTDMRWGHWTLHSVRPVRLQYADGVIRVGELTLAGRGAQMSAGGEISADGDLDLQVEISDDLRPGSWTSSKVEWLRGRLEIASRIGGTLHQPQLDGSASLTGGALRLASTRQALEELNVELSLAGRSITIDSGTAKLGGGRVTLGGQIVLPIGGLSDFSVRADLDAVKLLPQPEMYATVTGHLNLVGPIDDLLLRGRLTLDELRYTASFDLDRLIPRRHAPPLRVPALDPDATIRLAIGVQADNNVILRNNVVEAELQADLTVTGNSERVGLIGSVTPLWARARYLNNVFIVQRGSIDFSEEFRIFTQFDLRATTEACDMKIAVDVHGNSDVYNVTAKGEDENGAVDQNDVLACLQFGLRRQDFDARLSASHATESEDSSPLSNPMLASSLDVLWTVSGMDVKIRKLLPIELDEVRLESGWSSHFGRTTTRVRVGKDLGTNLQLKYARSLDEIDDQTLSIEYRLSDVAALEGNWLSASNVSVGDFGLDLRLRWEFR
jgi:autotransporter translocation and assembly factor TamB